MSNDIGIIELPDGGAYAVALLMTDGRWFYGQQTGMMAYASCVIYHALAEVEDPFAACPHP